MSRSRKTGRQHGGSSADQRDTPGADPLFDQMMELDRLEELLEELNELGILTVEQLEARIRELEAQIDDAPAPRGN